MSCKSAWTTIFWPLLIRWNWAILLSMRRCIATMIQKSFRLGFLVRTHSPTSFLEAIDKTIKNSFRSVSSTSNITLYINHLNYFIHISQVEMFFDIRIFLWRMISIEFYSEFDVVLFVSKFFHDFADCFLHLTHAPVHWAGSIENKKNINKIVVFRSLTTFLHFIKKLLIYFLYVLDLLTHIFICRLK